MWSKISLANLCILPPDAALAAVSRRQEDRRRRRGIMRSMRTSRPARKSLRPDLHRASAVTSEPLERRVLLAAPLIFNATGGDDTITLTMSPGVISITL